MQKMITAGIDVGNRFTKAVLQNDGEILSFSRAESGFDQKKAAEKAFRQAVAIAGATEDDVAKIIATGAGQREVDFATGLITDVSAAARGAIKIFPEARTVAEVGSETGKAIRMDGEGRVKNFTFNDKCAAGVGSFVESISHILQVSPEEMSLLALEAGDNITINAQCAVFAESEVISLIHAGIPRAEIAKAVLVAMAGRISSLVHRVGLEKEMAVIGGTAKSQAFITALEEIMQVKLLADNEKSEYFSALGAALAGKEQK